VTDLLTRSSFRGFAIVFCTVAVGVASAVLTLGSGPLYARFGAEGFWVMAGLCVAAVPVAPGPRREE